MYKLLLYFNAACITLAFFLGAFLRWGELLGFIKKKESQEKNEKNILPEKGKK